MVNTSLFTGLAGLRSHQTYIDVIGSNLANISTPGYRGSRVTFSDILSFTIQAGSGPNSNFGGQNPMQIGLGANVSSIDVNTPCVTARTRACPWFRFLSRNAM